MKKLAQIGFFALSLIFFALPQNVMAQDSSNIDLEKLQSAESTLESMLVAMETQSDEAPVSNHVNAAVMSPSVAMDAEKIKTCLNITYITERRIFIGRKETEAQKNNGNLSPDEYKAQLNRIQKAEDQLIVFREAAGL